MAVGNRKQANLIMQGGIATVISLLANACVLFRQIPLVRRIGSQGSSVYSAAFACYIVLWIVAAYGIPAVMETLIRPRLKQGQISNVRKVTSAAFFYTTLLGLAFGAALFFGSDFLSADFLHEPLASLPMKITGALVLFGAWNGWLRGYFQGYGAGTLRALSMLLEQVCATVAGLLLMNNLGKQGRKIGALLQNEAFEQTYESIGFLCGLVIGAAVSFVFLLLLYLITFRYYGSVEGGRNTKNRESFAQIFYVFFVCLLPVIGCGMFFRGYLAVEQFLFRSLSQGLLPAGEISASWGNYYGKYKVIAYIPFLITLAMGSTLQKKIRRYDRQDDERRIRECYQAYLRVITATIAPLAALIGGLAGPAVSLLYPDQKSNETLLAIGCVTAVFFSGAYLAAEALLGMRQGFAAALCGVLALGVQAGALFVMIEFMGLDIYGVLYADILYSFCLWVFLSVVLQKKARLRSLAPRGAALSIAVAAVVGGVLSFVSRIFDFLASPLPLIALLALLALFVYYMILLLLRGISERDLRLMPGGGLLLGVARALRLM